MLRILSVAAVMVGAIIPSIYAQTSGTASGTSTSSTLPTVVVTAESDRSLVSPSPESAQATLNRVAGGTNFLLAEDYKKGRASNLEDIFTLQPGVLAISRFGAEEARVSIRGSGIQRTFHGRGIKVLQDGLTLNEADGGFDMQALEPLAYRYVEVFRGANALQYGASTLGGAINFVTPTGYDSSLAQIRGETGSFGTWRGQISSGHVVGPFDYYATVTQSAIDGFRDFSQQNNQRVLANLGWRFNEDVETRFTFNYARSDSELPGSLTKAQAEQNPAQAAAGNVLRIDKRDFTYYRAAVKTTARFDEARLDTGIYWSNKDLDHPIFNVLTPGFATGPGTIDFVSNNLGGDFRWTDEADLFGRSNRFVIGLNPTASITEDARFENLNGTEARGRRFGDGTEESSNVEFYLENDHQVINGLHLILGFQATYARRYYEDRFFNERGTSTAPINSTDDQDYFGFSPKLGLRYDFTPKTNAFFNVSRSFEPPTFGELKVVSPSTAPPANPLPRLSVQNLEAQSANTIEVGTRGEWSRLTWDFAYYHAWVDNELLSLNDAGGAPLGTINGTSTIHQGVEIGLAVRLLEGLVDTSRSADEADALTLQMAYTWSDFFFASDPILGRNQLAGIPEHYIQAQLLYEHPCGFYAGPGLTWSAVKTPIDHANTFFADPYILFNFKTGYQSKRGFSVFVEGKNLGDKDYIATTGVIANANGADSAQFLPGNGLGIYGGVEWKY
jgi:iron complex outermembrane receptor protein